MTIGLQVTITPNQLQGMYFQEWLVLQPEVAEKRSKDEKDVGEIRLDLSFSVRLRAPIHDILYFFITSFPRNIKSTLPLIMLLFPMYATPFRSF